jgi:hypothetical protein
MPEPLIVGVPWNAISTLLRSNGSPFSQKGPSWKTQVVQWVSRLHTKGPLWKTEVRPKMGLHLFLEGTFVETGGGPIDPMLSYEGPSWKMRWSQWAFIFFGGHFCGNWRWSNWPYAFTRRTFLENEVVPMDLLFHRRDLHGKLKGPKRVFVFTKKDLSWKTKRSFNFYHALECHTPTETDKITHKFVKHYCIFIFIFMFIIFIFCWAKTKSCLLMS